MKLSFILCALAISGCATHVVPPPPPPPEMPVVVVPAPKSEEDVQKDSEAQDKARAVRKEQRDWEASTARIQAILDKHQLDYNICIAVSGHTSKSCAHMLEQFCERSTYIDTRGGHIEDPMCESPK